MTHGSDKKHLRRLCKCHEPAMGHTFGGDNLQCVKVGCSVNWHRHQQNPEPCVSLVELRSDVMELE